MYFSLEKVADDLRFIMGVFIREAFTVKGSLIYYQLKLVKRDKTKGTLGTTTPY